MRIVRSCSLRTRKETLFVFLFFSLFAVCFSLLAIPSPPSHRRALFLLLDHSLHGTARNCPALPPAVRAPPFRAHSPHAAAMQQVDARRSASPTHVALALSCCCDLMLACTHDMAGGAGAADDQQAEQRRAERDWSGVRSQSVPAPAVCVQMEHGAPTGGVQLQRIWQCILLT